MFFNNMIGNYYDVVIVGGSIGGSIAGRLTAEKGFSTLIVEAAKTPREKPCSGIQFKYFEKLIGKKIPSEKLCTNELDHLFMEFPDGHAYRIPFQMLNFKRDVFDDWLNKLAISAGVEFKDTTRFVDYEFENELFTIAIKPRKGDLKQVKCKYFIVADGLMSKIRRKMTPENFLAKPFAPTMNYYLKTEGDGDLNPNTLYQFWNLDFSNTMFAWVYKKDDLWVVGTGHTDNFMKRCDLLLDYVANKFNLKQEIVKREGFASTIDLLDPNHVYLGKDNLLLVGDAAGLVDMYRGLGMDAAALSGRLAAKAIYKAEMKGYPAMHYYANYMKRIVKKIKKNSFNLIFNNASNDELLQDLKKRSLKIGIGTLFANMVNTILPADKIILLPL